MSAERREFLRLNFKQPIEYKKIAANSGAGLAISKNISESGILFSTPTNPPDLSSIVLMDLDYRTVSICKEIEKRALIFNNSVVGRVVRVEENPEKNQTYDIGVCFVTQDQADTRDIQQALIKA